MNLGKGGVFVWFKFNEHILYNKLQDILKSRAHSTCWSIPEAAYFCCMKKRILQSIFGHWGLNDSRKGAKKCLKNWLQPAIVKVLKTGFR